MNVYKNKKKGVSAPVRERCSQSAGVRKWSGYVGFKMWCRQDVTWASHNEANLTGSLSHPRLIVNNVPIWELKRLLGFYKYSWSVSVFNCCQVDEWMKCCWILLGLIRDYKLPASSQWRSVSVLTAHFCLLPQVCHSDLIFGAVNW